MNFVYTNLEIHLLYRHLHGKPEMIFKGFKDAPTITEWIEKNNLKVAKHDHHLFHSNKNDLKVSH